MTAANIAHIEEFIAPENLSSEPAEKVAIRKQLAKWISAKEPHAEILTITPEMAQIMLERNLDNNRARNSKVVGRYRREIQENRMRLTNQGIGFDRNGALIDGQHRLMACIAAEKAFQSQVTFGLEPDAFMLVDSGYVRRGGHKASIAGFRYGVSQFAAAKTVLLYELTEIALSAFARRAGIYPKNAYSNEIPEEWCVDFLRENPGFSELTAWYPTYKKFRPISPSLFQAAHWILRQKHPRLADAFIEQLALGEGLKRSDNVWRLRDHLLNIHMSRERLSKTWVFCWIIDAFNDTRREKATKFIMVDGRDFPKVLS